MLLDSYNKPTVIVVAGPTASGKTTMALALAKKYNTSIISADSRQCYQELNIGVAKPSVSELLSAQHYFINSHSIQNPVDAVIFEQYALCAVQNIFKNNNVAILCGGTGLYIKVFCEGIDDIPKTPADLRTKLMADYDTLGIEYLQTTLAVVDPDFIAQTTELENPARLMRALEVKLHTGKSITSFREGIKKQRDFDIIKLGIDLPREHLYNNINVRVDQMMHDGLLDEVQSLQDFKHLSALQTVGYAELFDYLSGSCSLQYAVDKIKQHTRNYAKRQLTWFRKDTSIHWIQKPNSSLSTLQ
jgi:tRNA dimethylallyltransferase